MIYLAIFGTFSIGPIPSSPHANVLKIGGSKVISKAVEDARYVVIMGCCHMYVFKAGITRKSFARIHLGGQARATQVSKLSQRLLVSFASVLTDAGVITKTSAHSCDGRL